MITNQQIYALKAMRYLAWKGLGIVVSRQEIADAEEIPTHFLAKILQDLSKRGLIDIRQGSRGGPVLIKSPDEITLLDVLEICGGPFRFNRTGGGKIDVYMERAEYDLRDGFDEKTISDLVEDKA